MSWTKYINDINIMLRMLINIRIIIANFEKMIIIN